jgi:hypothetical protein
MLLALVLGGCATGDFVRAAHVSLDRAARVEPTSAFFAPILARAKGEPAPPPPSWQARQHYLAVVFNLERLPPEAENTLRRNGTLGDAFVLKTLAQWRIGRIDDARASALRARASGQEAIDAQHRALFRAFEGVLKLHAAYDAVAEGKPLQDVETIVSGENGVWRTLASARTELTRGDPLQRELILARLAAFKVLRDARRSRPESETTSSEEWRRLQAEARIELADLAALPTDRPTSHAAVVRQWEALCGLGSIPSTS